VSEGASRSEATFRINPAIRLTVDVHDFERALRVAAAADDQAERRAQLVAAIELYTGDFFTECYQDWAEETRRRLGQRYSDALAQLADLDWRSGQFRSCLGWCERLVDLDPLSEPVHYRMLACYEQLGEALAGVTHYRRYATDLAEDAAGQNLRLRPGSLLSARLLDIYQRLEAAQASIG
jgi:two-component SAPR family response regulator